MLLQLTINNFALIEKASLDFKEGFTILSGETGAGKSILIDAINYVQGSKFNKDLIRTGEEKTFVEAIFSIDDNERLKEILDDLEIEYDDTLIISRETFINGRSNIKVNGRSIIVATLKKISSTLLDIHGQHNNQNLLNKETTPENIKRYCYMWIKMYNDFLEDPNGEDKLFFKAPALIIVKSESTVNASLAASNMELMTNALGLGTYFSGFLQRASEVNPKINEFLGLKENESLVNCMVIGYPKVKYKRTVPRKEAKITWM